MNYNEQMNNLKSFQKATVDRVMECFNKNQNRVIVADEVGLGKTLIAKGVMLQMADLYEKNHQKVFRTIYLCSNQSIISQNMEKLNVFNLQDRNYERLSMQSLKIFETEAEYTGNGLQVQLNAFTPETSLSTNGCGIKEERAYIYNILIQLYELKAYKIKLKQILRVSAKSQNFNNTIKDIRKRIDDLVAKNSDFLEFMLKELSNRLKKEKVLEEIIKCCENQGQYKDVIQKLRKIFADISLKKLKPDLIIMDEFQKFNTNILKQDDKNTELQMITKKFFNNKNTKILLLSATPYKLYSTLKEIEKDNSDEHYEGFYQVINFALNDNEKIEDFKEKWRNYSLELKKMDFKNEQVKKEAEDAMYEVMCRTERENAIKKPDDTPLKIQENDIKLHYNCMQKINKLKDFKDSLNIQQAKSTPFILSYMVEYKLKENLEKYLRKNQNEINKIDRKYSWIKKEDIKEYKEIKNVNARLEKLKEVVFKNDTEKLLWIPPTKPYYEFGEIYKNSKDASKTLVFSEYRMVPKMISTLISYEAERRTIARVKKDKKLQYFNLKNSFASEMLFSLGKDQIELMTVLYPSKKLASFFNPIEVVNGQKSSIEELNKKIAVNIRKELEKEIKKYKIVHKKKRNKNEKEDNRWYYLLPLLIDDDEYVDNWFARNQEFQNKETNKENDKENGKKPRTLYDYIVKLEKEYRKVKKNEIKLGKIPSKLYSILASVAIASPAICAYRALFQEPIYATKIGQLVLELFNSNIAHSIINLYYKKDKYWKNVLKYCQDGNLQAMLDEYIHMIGDNNPKNVFGKIQEAMSIKTTTEAVDTYNSFRDRVINGSKNRAKTELRMRTHFATGFYQTVDDEKNIRRTDSVRTAFNSPFRPFVLSTTSIGQEGLDFHYYCRRIVHWNLPHNPVEIEQREGRINRYKCLAIRKYLAENCNIDRFEKDIWEEIFANVKDEDGMGMIPFWCLPNNEKIDIDRIYLLYEYSSDIAKYKRLIDMLSLYRITLGQSRQEELLNSIMNNKDIDKNEVNKFLMNLCPYKKMKN